MKNWIQNEKFADVTTLNILTCYEYELKNNFNVKKKLLLKANNNQRVGLKTQYIYATCALIYFI